jgi:hypothetical protein
MTWCQSMTPLQLVAPPVDEDTVMVLSNLLLEALSGRLTGVAYVALYRRNEYSGDVAGLIRSNPLLALGVCRALEDVIASKR